MFRRHNHSARVRELIALIDVLEEQLAADEVELERAAAQVRYITTLLNNATQKD